MYYNTKKDIALSNQEELGKQLLHKGCSFILKKNFEAAFSYISDGYELITCDCPRGGWFEDTYNQQESIFQLATLESDEPEFHFCLSFSLFYIALGEYGNDRDSSMLAQSLVHIDKYLSYHKNYLGLYFKGRILSFFKRPEEAVTCFNMAFKAKVTTPTLYRASLVRETLSEDSLYGLYRACLNNPSSLCAWEHLHSSAVVKRGIALTTDKVWDRTSMLARQFNSDTFNYFSNTFKAHFREPKGTGGGDNWAMVFAEPARSTENDSFIRYNYEFSSNLHRTNYHLCEFQDFVSIMATHAHLFNEPELHTDSAVINEPKYDYVDDDNDNWGGDIDNNPYYNDDLDMDQQGQEFWDNL